jgi:hypothetical protein
MSRGAVLVALAVLVGCSPGFEIRRLHAFDRKPRIEAIVVLAPEFRFRGETPDNIYLRQMDLVELLRESTSVAVIDATEVYTFVPGSPRFPLRETNITEILSDLGIGSESVLVFRPTLIESWQEGSTVTAQNEAVASREPLYSSSMIFQMEVTRLSDDLRLLSVSARREFRRARLATEFDENPNVTEFLADVFARIVDRVTDEYRLGRPGPSAAQWALIDSPAYALGLCSAADAVHLDLAPADDLAREAALNRITLRRSPGLTPEMRRVVVQSRSGIVVQRAPECSFLAPEDVIVSVDGRNVVGTHQLERSLRHLGRSEGRTLGIIRGGEYREFTLEPACCP